MKLENKCKCKKSSREELAQTQVLEAKVDKRTTREYSTRYYMCYECDTIYYQLGSALKVDNKRVTASNTELKQYSGTLTAGQLKKYAPEHKGTITRLDEIKIYGGK